MPLPQPRPALVLHYGYLWHDQYHRGREEGIKDRPCIIVSVRAMLDGRPLVAVVPITHRRPPHLEDAIEMSAATKRRLGLDDAPSWIILNDLNRFRWPGPDLRPVPARTDRVYAYGFLPLKLYQQVKDGVLDSAKRSRVRLTHR